MKRLVLCLPFLLVAPVASAESLSQNTAPLDRLRVERILTTRTILDSGSTTPRVIFSEAIVLEGAEMACTFTIECNDNGTFNATFEGCTATQAKKIFEAAADIC